MVGCSFSRVYREQGAGSREQAAYVWRMISQGEGLRLLGHCQKYWESRANDLPESTPLHANKAHPSGYRVEWKPVKLEQHVPSVVLFKCPESLLHFCIASKLTLLYSFLGHFCRSTELCQILTKLICFDGVKLICLLIRSLEVKCFPRFSLLSTSPLRLFQAHSRQINIKITIHCWKCITNIQYFDFSLNIINIINIIRATRNVRTLNNIFKITLLMLARRAVARTAFWQLTKCVIVND